MTDTANTESVQTRQILVIDNDANSIFALEQYFGPQGFTVSVAKTGADGLNLAQGRLPALILMSTQLPDKPAQEVFLGLRGRARTSSIPVMFLADRVDAKLQNELLAAGADDFIAKPFDVELLGLRVRNAIQRREREGVHHPLSGLPTGRVLQEHVRALADEYGWYKIDLGINNFEGFREQYGFMSSQEVLAFAAKLINEVLLTAGTPEDFIGHRDDDEFIIITRLEQGPQVRTLLEQRFNDEVMSFYNFMEREQGFVEGPDSSGNITKKPLMTAKIKVQEGEPDDPKSFP